MNHKWTIAALAAVVALVFGPDLMACGDKFLVPGRGTRFQRTPSERQASTVLLYAPAGSDLARTLTALKIDVSIRKAGYRPAIVATPEALRTATATRWDVVVVDPANGSTVRARLPAASLTHLLAIVPTVTATELAQVRAQYPLVLKTPQRAQDVLDAIDEAAGCARLDQARAGKPR